MVNPAKIPLTKDLMQDDASVDPFDISLDAPDASISLAGPKHIGQMNAKKWL